MLIEAERREYIIHCGGCRVHVVFVGGRDTIPM